MTIVRLSIDLDVGEAPAYADAVAWFIHQYGSVTPELLGGDGGDVDAIEAVVLDVLGAGLADHDQAVGWQVLALHVEAVGSEYSPAQERALKAVANRFRGLWAASPPPNEPPAR